MIHRSCIILPSFTASQTVYISGLGGYTNGHLHLNCFLLFSDDSGVVCGHTDMVQGIALTKGLDNYDNQEITF